MYEPQIYVCMDCAHDGKAVRGTMQKFLPSGPDEEGNVTVEMICPECKGNNVMPVHKKKSEPSIAKFERKINSMSLGTAQH